MRIRSRERPSRHLSALSLAVLLASVAVLVVGPGAPAGAQPRRVVVIGDSVILGARPQLVRAFQRNGWATTFDASVSRSTLAGAQVVRSHAAELTDTLVISLGANDGGNTATFRQRVDAVMAAATGVPHVYWLTIREVRPYYAAANAVLRAASERYPNLDVIDWNAATVGRRGLTAGDGLHLTAAGAGSMAFLVAGTVMTAPPAAGQAPTTTVAPAPTTAAPGVLAAPTTIVGVAAAPVTAAPESVVTTTSVAPAPSTTNAPSSRSDVGRIKLTADDGGIGWSGWSVGVGLLGVVVVLAVAGGWIAVRALLRSRGSSAGPGPDHPGGTGPDGGTDVPQRSERSRLRAARIAESRAHHPTSNPEGAPTRTASATTPQS